MDVNWWEIGSVAFCAIILIVYLFRRNLKDEKDVTNSFNERTSTEEKFEFDDEDN